MRAPAVALCLPPRVARPFALRPRVLAPLPVERASLRAQVGCRDAERFEPSPRPTKGRPEQVVRPLELTGRPLVRRALSLAPPCALLHPDLSKHARLSARSVLRVALLRPRRQTPPRRPHRGPQCCGPGACSFGVGGSRTL